jgi:hypothetical protein
MLCRHNVRTCGFSLFRCMAKWRLFQRGKSIWFGAEKSGVHINTRWWSGPIKFYAANVQPVFLFSFHMYIFPLNSIIHRPLAHRYSLLVTTRYNTVVLEPATKFCSSYLWQSLKRGGKHLWESALWRSHCIWVLSSCRNLDYSLWRPFTALSKGNIFKDWYIFGFLRKFVNDFFSIV